MSLEIMLRYREREGEYRRTTKNEVEKFPFVLFPFLKRVRL